MKTHTCPGQEEDGQYWRFEPKAGDRSGFHFLRLWRREILREMIGEMRVGIWAVFSVHSVLFNKKNIFKRMKLHFLVV